MMEHDFQISNGVVGLASGRGKKNLTACKLSTPDTDLIESPK